MQVKKLLGQSAPVNTQTREAQPERPLDTMGIHVYVTYATKEIVVFK